MAVQSSTRPEVAPGQRRGGSKPPMEPQRSRGVLGRLDIKYSPYLYIAPFFVVFGIFGLWPLIYTLRMSLYDWDLGSTVETAKFVGFDNFTMFLGDSDFWNSVVNTIAMFLMSTIPQLILALILANALNKRLRGRTLLRMGVLIPNITSVAAVSIVFTQLYNRDFGLINWVLGFVGVEPIDWTARSWSSWVAISSMVDWRWTGYNALIFLAAMQSIPRDIYESASIDGASGWRQFWTMTVPMLRPTIIFVTIISTIGGLQLYGEPLLFTGGGNPLLGGSDRQSQTVTMFLMEQFYMKFELGRAATVAWLLFILIMIFSIINFLFTRSLRSADGKAKQRKGVTR
ncbi:MULTISPECIES: carbohydrate ABC transporter permease [Catellatospora]|uniref:carbohydrate ABC transporter permease n=1 Tax=Catellatospora TaxID=53365 RepID=UPI000E765631|nr:cellobiose transport system permease protein [Catellatospora citrea]